MRPFGLHIFDDLGLATHHSYHTCLADFKRQKLIVMVSFALRLIGFLNWKSRFS